MLKRINRVLCGAVLGTAPLWAAAATEVAPSAHIPELHGTTFAGQAVALPQDLHGRPGVLVVGFTQASRNGIAGWGKRLAGDYFGSPAVAYFEMPVLESVPRLMRGFVLGRIKADVSERGRTTFLPILDHEADWKRTTSFHNEDDAYILLVDPAGQVRWRTQGAVTDALYADLQQQLKAIQTVR